MIVVLSLAAVSAFANVQIFVHLQQPMPHSFTEWQRNDKNLVWVEIRNYDPASYPNVRLSGSVKFQNGGRVVASTKDADPSMPRFMVPQRMAPGVASVTILRGRECINANAIAIDNQIRAQAITTNSLPEDAFEFCVKLLKEDGTDLTSSGTGDECASFSVVLADPPQLIMPQDQEGLPALTLPRFVWAPVAPVPPGTVITYWLKIVPVFTGQSTRDAIDHNEVLYRAAMPVTAYQYMPSDRAFSAFPGAIAFAWQIEAIDETGKPITSNEGKSDISQFHFDPQAALTQPPMPDPPVSGGR